MKNSLKEEKEARSHLENRFHERGSVPIGKFVARITLDDPFAPHPLTGQPHMDQLVRWANNRNKYYDPENDFERLDVLEADKETGVLRIKGSAHQLASFLDSISDSPGVVIRENKMKIKKSDLSKLSAKELMLLEQQIRSLHRTPVASTREGELKVWLNLVGAHNIEKVLKGKDSLTDEVIAALQDYDAMN